VLLNREGKRFMFADIPDNYRTQTADSEEEGWRYTQGDKSARRPPELLTRDHVARCILREVREGRGSPHGGVFLDISWIKRKLPEARKHIIRKLPSMYHQFKQLADIDITTTPMEVGPTTHYIMGGVRVDGDSQMSTLPGLFAAGECAAGLHGANRLGGNSLSDLVVFGKRAGEHAARFAASNGAPAIDARQAERTQREMEQALASVRELSRRAARVVVRGNREYNPGWHTALDLRNLLTVAEAIARAALERRESRGGHFRDDYPEKDAAFGTFNLVLRKGPDGEMQMTREPIP